MPAISSLERTETAISARGGLACAAKRSLDLGGALALLALALPVLAIVALSVLLCSGRPVLYRQLRVGHREQRFRLLKFRSMVPDAERLGADLWAGSSDPSWLRLTRDPRVTRVGRVLRRLSLDELPQLWHVLRGDMSLVGPRPLSLADDANVPAWARGRTDVKPGMTGVWQVRGRTNLSFQQMLVLDVSYARSWSLGGDLGVLLRTVPAVLTARGAS